jgi:hypothetical protein
MDFAKPFTTYQYQVEQSAQHACEQCRLEDGQERPPARLETQSDQDAHSDTNNDVEETQKRHSAADTLKQSACSLRGYEEQRCIPNA